LAGDLAGKAKGRGIPGPSSAWLQSGLPRVTLLDYPLNVLSVVTNTLQMRLNPHFDPLELFSQSLVHTPHWFHLRG
jgi:hypothetical protein